MTFDRTIRLAAVTPDRIGEAACTAAIAMRDNPVHIAALGEDPARRVRVMRAVFERHLASARRSVIAAWHGDSIVGITAFTGSGDCAPTPRELIGFLPALVGAGRGALKLLEWQRTWSQLEPKPAHSHLGPVAVAEEHRRHGIGSMLLSEYTGHLDSTGQTGYLETDKAENVGFYERHGFVVAGRAHVIGVPNWFMVRRPL